MDRACAAEEQQQHSQNFNALDTLRQTEQRAPKNNLVRNIRKGTKRAQLQLERRCKKVSKDRRRWKDFASALCAT